MQQEDLDLYNRQRIFPREDRERVRQAVNALLSVKPEHYFPVLLSEARTDLMEYIYKHFLKYNGDKNNSRSII